MFNQHPELIRQQGLEHQKRLIEEAQQQQGTKNSKSSFGGLRLGFSTLFSVPQTETTCAVPCGSAACTCY